MNRRRAMKLIGLASGAVLTGLSTQALSCSASQIENEINVILEGLANLLAAAGQTAWSTDLSTAEQALAAAEQSWQTGGAVQILITALNAVEAICAVIPLVDVYSPFIDLAVTAIETVLTLLPASTAPAARAMRQNAHLGRVPNFKSARAAAQQWNTTVAALPALNVAKVKVPLF
jgi:hypothetical protein